MGMGQILTLTRKEGPVHYNIMHADQQQEAKQDKQKRKARQHDDTYIENACEHAQSMQMH